MAIRRGVAYLKAQQHGGNWEVATTAPSPPERKKRRPHLLAGNTAGSPPLLPMPCWRPGRTPRRNASTTGQNFSSIRSCPGSTQSGLNPKFGTCCRRGRNTAA